MHRDTPGSGGLYRLVVAVLWFSHTLVPAVSSTTYQADHRLVFLPTTLLWYSVVHNWFALLDVLARRRVSFYLSSSISVQSAGAEFPPAVT